MAGMYGCFKSRNSDSAAMASGPPEVMANQEPAEAGEECSGKKKSKFQTFKKFFARKKRKEPPAAGADAGLKASQSSDNVSKASDNNTLTRSEKEKGSGSKISLGSKALSHDSVFVSDSSEPNDALGASQDSIHGKVKSLQNQLKQAIRLGSPPSLICVKKAEDAGTMSEDDGLPCSPPEYTALHAVMNQAQRNSSVSLEGIDSDDDQLSCAASSRAVSPLVVPGDFSQPASPFGCLDNSAAKHKLGLRNKACNRRKPVSRLELRPERDSVVEEVKKTSITETLEEKLQQKTTEGVSNDELKEKVKREEDKEEEEQQQGEEEEHSKRSSLQESEDGEVEADAAQDVSHGADTSCPEPCGLEEEESPDGQAPPASSSRSSSRTSSLHSPRVSPEPPAGPREYLLDPPGVAYGVAESDSVLRGGREEDVVSESEEKESSLLQEVLSSLKTPLASSSLDVETVEAVAEVEAEHEVVGKEDVEAEEGEESMEGEAEEEEEEPVSHQAVPVASHLSAHTTEEEEEEEEEVVIAPSCSPPLCEDVEEEEEKIDDVEGEAAAADEEEEEEQVVEQLSPHGQKEEEDEEEAEEVEPEEQSDTLAVNKAEEATRAEEEESEGEEEAIELEKEAEVEEEGWEKREVEDEDVEMEEVKERLDEAEEAVEEEGDNAEEMTEVFPGAAGEEAEDTDEGVDVEVGDELAASTLQQEDKVPTEMHHEVSAAAAAEEQEDEEERVEEAIEVDHTEGEAEQPDGEVEDTHSDKEQEREDQTKTPEQAPISSEPTPSPPPESQQSGTSAPSKPSTTTLHINLHSPSSEKVPSFFKPAPAQPKESESPSQAVADTEEEQDEPVEAAAAAEEEEEENQETPPPASVEDVLQQPSRGLDQSKVRFTIAPAWKRSLSEEEPREEEPASSSPLTCTPSAEVEVEAASKKDPEVKAEPVSPSKVELVLSPGRGRTAGPTTTKPASSATSLPPANKPQSSAAASAEESSVVVEGNPDNPFGVRLRKTSVLHRFSSEEESTEPPAEPPAQPTSCKADSPQPISTKPSINQPISSKPALPKKPDVHGDSAGKSKRVSEPPAARGVSSGSESPSWISMAKQKQKIYKENSLEEITVKKEEQERKTSLPMYVSSAVSREHSNKAAEPAGKVSPVEITKPSVSVEKESRRSLSPPTPVPAQPPKSQALPCPVPPKPQPPPAATKPSPQRSLSPPTPVPVPQKSLPSSCTSPPPLSKTAPSPQTAEVTSPPFSSRTAPEKPAPRAPGLSGPSPAHQRGLGPQALPQDEPPWMALAKKKAKAWSEMPQIVQ